jgi:uncharacterized protein (TIGR02646 family)
MSILRICNIRQMPGHVAYNANHMALLARMPRLNGTEWDGPLPRPPWKWGDGTKVNGLIISIKTQLKIIQGDVCAFCGMNLYVTSGAQVEHIAPKGIGRYPQFMFTPQNLAFACSLCNGFEKKEKKEHFNTIGVLNVDYVRCYFNIVHPHLDNPDLHYDIRRAERHITISHRTLKGQKSIAIFKLDEEPLTTERGKAIFVELYDFDPKFRIAFHEACKRNSY